VVEMPVRTSSDAGCTPSSRSYCPASLGHALSGRNCDADPASSARACSARHTRTGAAHASHIQRSGTSSSACSSETFHGPPHRVDVALWMERFGFERCRFPEDSRCGSPFPFRGRTSFRPRARSGIAVDKLYTDLAVRARPSVSLVPAAELEKYSDQRSQVDRGFVPRWVIRGARWFVTGPRVIVGPTLRVRAALDHSLALAIRIAPSGVRRSGRAR
jgi:hypothetical protein